MNDKSCRGSLQRVQGDLCELERKFETADGKVQAHYHEQLKELESNQEALQKEVSTMREEREASTPKPAMPSPPTTLKWKRLAVLTGPSMPRVSPCMALNDLRGQRLWGH